MALKHVSKKNLAKKDLGTGAKLAWGPTTITYLLAGRCVTTLVRKADAVRHTYFISQASDDVKQGDGTTKEVLKQLWFVNLLVGSDNTRSYKYIGVIDDRFGVRRFRTTAKTKAVSADSINMIGDTIKWLADGASASHKVEVWQRGFCGRCCAELTVPSSIATGLGPDCAGYLGVTMKKVDPSTIEKLASLAPVEPAVPAVVEAAAKSVGAALGIPVSFAPPPVEPEPEPEPAGPDPIETAIDALVEAAGLPEAAKVTIAAVVAGLKDAGAAHKTLKSLRTKKKDNEEAA